MSVPADKTQISIRVPTSTVEAFERIARILERDRTWVMLRAFSRYLEQEGVHIVNDAEGLKALDRGEGIDFDSVMDEAENIIAAAERKRRAIAP